MKIKKGDTVIVIAGKDKGKTGTVAAAFPKEQAIVIEGVNMHKKHERARTAGGKGQVIERAMPIHVSNVLIWADGKRTRVAKKKIGDAYVRIGAKTHQEIK